MHTIIPYKNISYKKTLKRNFNCVAYGKLTLDDVR